MVELQKYVFTKKPLSEILYITNVPNSARMIWACAEEHPSAPTLYISFQHKISALTLLNEIVQWW